MDDIPEGRGPSSLLVAGLIALAVIAYFAIGTLRAGGEEASETLTREPFAVLVRPAAPENRPALVTLRGRTEAGATVPVRAETAARVEAVLTTEGAQVRRGDPLCRLEDAGRSAGLAEADAALVQARTEASAAERLYAEGFAARAQADAARASLRAAEARRDAAAKAAGDALIRAPIDGTVTALPAETGDVLAPGAPCAVLSDLTRTLVAGEVSGAEAARLSVGAPAQVSVAREDLQGTVRFVAPTAGPNGAYRVEIDLARGGLQSGLTAAAVIEAGRTGAALVPRAALVLDDQGALGLRVVEASGAAREGLVAFRPVRPVGETREGAYVEGLRPTDRVIVRGQDYVTAGARVPFRVEGEVEAVGGGA